MYDWCEDYLGSREIGISGEIKLRNIDREVGCSSIEKIMLIKNDISRKNKFLCAKVITLITFRIWGIA